MADPITFDDLIPAQGAGSASALTFDDLVPRSPKSSSSSQMSIAMPEIDPMGFPTGRALPPGPMNTMPYSEQMANVGHALLSAGDRVGANIPFADRMTAAMGAATGVGGKLGDYSGNLANERAQNAIAAIENPVGERVAGIVGSSLTPIPAAAWVGKGATLLDKTVRGGMAGGGLGLTQGLSSTPDLTKPDYQQLLESGLVGAGTGAALPPLAAAAGAGYRALANAAAPSVPGLSRSAQRVLSGTIMADNPALVQQELERLGPNATLADTGPSSRGAAIGLAKDEGGAAKTIAQSNIAARDAGTNQRLRDTLQQTVGPDLSPQALSDALQARRSELHAGFPALWQQTPNADPSDILATVGQKLNTAVGSEAAVLNRVRNNLMEPVEGGGVVPTNSAEKMHNTKIDLDSLIKRGDPTLGVAPGQFSKTQGTIGQIRTQLNQSLRDQVPGYADINIPSSQLAGAIDAIKAGRDRVLVSGQNALHPADYASQFAGLPEAEQLGQRAGLASNLYRATGTQNNDLVALNRVMQGTGEDAAGWNHQKLGTAFGAQPMSNLDQALGAENTFKQLSQPALQNSVTTPAAQAIKQINSQVAPPGELFPNSLRNLTSIGAGSEPFRWAANRIASAMRTPVDPNQIKAELAHAYTGVLGPRALEMARQLIEGSSAQISNSAKAQQLAHALMTGGAVAGNVGANAELAGPR